MKTFIIVLFFLSFSMLVANPIALVFISEIYFEGDDWTIELYDYYEAGISSLDNYCIMSSSDSTYFNNGIYFEPGEVILVTEEDLQSSLSINKGGDFVLIFGNDFDDLVLAEAMLRRIGYDNILGFLRNGVNQWSASGRETDSIEVMSLDEFGAKQTRREVIVIDVREPHEYDLERIEDSVSFPLTGLEEKAEIFTTDGPIATVCPSGSRSTTAASILKWKGADEIAVSLDGLKAWKAFDYPLEKD